MVKISSISLYFHIPFCTKKCDYCNFYVVPDKEQFKLMFMEGLRLEWKRALPELIKKKVATVYFGGGTPTLLGAPFISEILEWIHRDLSFVGENPEITIEANPEDVTKELMRAYASAGINRVSIGVQTLDNTMLKQLGRLHDAKKALDAVCMTQEIGISNISVDLMYDLPTQTLQGWQSTLHQVRDLPITHLSLYNLTIEPHTVFFKHRETIQKVLPGEEISLKMYEMAVAMLNDKQLTQYEISAFARDGQYSRHNVGYWTARPFMGFGPSAFSYWEGKRFRNIANLSQYCRALKEGRSPVDFEEELVEESRIRELLVINLRLIEGVDLDLFQQQHGALGAEDLNILKRLEGVGLLTYQDQRLRLTKRGVLFYDTLAVELI